MGKIARGVEYDNKVKEETKKLNIQVVLMLVISALISFFFYSILDNNPPAEVYTAVQGVDLGNNTDPLVRPTNSNL